MIIMLKKIGFLFMVLCLQTLFATGMVALSIIILIPLVAASASKSSPTNFIILILLFGAFVFAVPLASAIWSYSKTRQLMKKEVDTLLPPIGWFFVNLFFWFPGLTIYIFLSKFSFQTNSARVLT